MTLNALAMESPLGNLQLISEADYLIELNWEGAHKALSTATRSEPAILTTAADELSQFFRASDPSSRFRLNRKVRRSN